MSSRAERAKAIFLEALENHPPQEWPAWLDQACADDTLLRPEVEKLLAAHIDLGSFHEGARPTIPGTPASGLLEGIGAVIGPYRLAELIGEGGFGAVYLAEQTEPVRRKVALKVLKPGMDTRQIVARFEAERQALAIMDHPNIAKVLDGGATPTGRPYFVMDLVKGVPITDFCDQHHLTPRQRLELFIPICHAVQHAHQKGIIHRDIKPRNVLIAKYDDQPVPKVIDFGVAKATGQQLSEETLHTGYGAVVGTVEYMSPEQASFNQLDVDTRSDIYSLGVLLYELLTGTTPLKHKQVKQTPLLEVLRMIREDDAERPSARLDTVEDLPAVAASRGVEPRKLSGLVRGELDWIVMKALEKNRGRRYETADGLAADVQRYLNNEPVQACPPSTAYRFRKFASRNKVPLATGALVAVLLLVTSTVLAVSNVRIDQALGDKTEALQQRGRAFDDLEKQQKKVAQTLDDVTKLVGKLQEEQKQTRQALYFHSIALADREWWLNNVDKAEEILDQCAVEHRDWEWHYLKRRCRAGMVLYPSQDPPGPQGFQGLASRLTFSPDGERLAVSFAGQALRDGYVKVWNARTGKELLKIDTPTFTVRQFAFSPDGNHLAVPNFPNDNGTVARILDSHTGLEIRRITGARNVHFAMLAYSAAGDQLALGSETGLVKICDANTGMERQTIRHKVGIAALSLSPDGKRLATAGRDNIARVWDLASGTMLFELAGPFNAVSCVQYSPDGRLLVAGCRHAWRTFDAETGKGLLTLPLDSEGDGQDTGDVRHATFSPDSRHLLTTAFERTLRVLSAATGSGLGRLRGHGREIHNVAWGSAGFLASVAGDGEVRIWPTGTLTGPKNSSGVRPLALSPDGRLLASYERSAMIVRDLRLDQVQATLALPTDTHATRARISPDLRMLAVAWTANADPKVRFQTRVWEAATGQVIGTLRTAATPVASLAYRPDSGRLAAAAHGNLIIWDMPAAKEVLSVPIEGAPPHVLEYSPDAKLLAGCSTAGPKDVQVTLWDATTCKELRRWKIPAPFGWSLAFCSESKLLAVGTVDNEVRIYSVDAELPVRVLRGPIGLVRFAPGNKRLVNWWLKDRTAKIWDIQTGRELLTLRGHERGIYHGALANDGVFTTADDHGNVRVFDGRPWVNDAAPVSK